MTDNDPYEEHTRSGIHKRELALLRSMFDKAPICIAITEGPEHRAKYINAALCNLLGYSSLPSGITAGEILPEIKSGDEQEVQNTLQRLNHIYATGESLIVNELKSKLNQGGSGPLEERYFNFIYQPLKDENDEVYGLFLAGYEVTDHVHAREEVVHGEHRLSLALNGAKLGYWEIEAHTNTLDVASRQLKMHYGLPAAKKITYEDLINAVHPEDRSLVQESISEVMQDGQLYEMQYRICWPDGSLHWLMARGRLLRNRHGQPYRRIGITMDITPQKEAEQKLQEAVRLRDDFLAIASHELQTPLTSMKMQVELAKQQLLEAGHQPFGRLVEKIHKNVHRLSGLTNRLLDMSRMRQDGLSLEKNRFSLSKLIEEKANMFRSVSHHVIEVQGQAPLEVYADRVRIGQVLSNLIENAIKYSPEADRVVIRYGEKPGRVEVSVIDFGIGVPKEDQQKIFERFFKGSGDNKNTYPGFGIGLYVARQIIEHHDGGIWLEDNLQGGSVFSFSLPTAGRHKTDGV